MQPKSIFSQLAFCLLVCLLPIYQAAASTSDTLVVRPHFYHIDYHKKLILVNQNLDELNSESNQPKKYLLLDSLYDFQQVSTQVQTNTSYQVKLANVAYTLYFTQLPVVHVSAKRPIVDAPSVYAQFSLADTTGRFMTANTGIEIRGGASQGFPKKSYELSFWADTVGLTSQDVQFGTMRTADKWNLQAMYNEPLRIRSKSANELWQEMDTLYYHAAEPDAKSGIATTYTELFLNGEYAGVYQLAERIDRKQLKLKKYNKGIVGELYKGVDWGGAVTFTGLPAFYNTSETWGGFEYKYPDEKIDWTALYDFVNFVENSSNQTFFQTYRQRFNLANAVDYYIFLNVVRATDNTGKNLYVARYKAGEPYYYVPWDLDGVFGTNYAGQNDPTTTGLLSNGFYDRLRQDCSPTGFGATLQRRWAQLRKTVLAESHILGKFQQHTAYLRSNNVYEREKLTWSAFTDDAAQTVYMTNWLHNRLSYLDGEFANPCPTITAVASAQEKGNHCYPNPAKEVLHVEHEATASELVIRDLLGKTVVQVGLTGTRTSVDMRSVAPGMYLVTISSKNASQTQKLIVE
ncbi:hypothetical protein GCM10022409_03820 [Hymenobacter glaciei]|uniref:Secretion system C-terminal sorting domain-containing protein n=1 Tax=Hymenobacter glaciei TaxID=877209 RepID=A0ABP7T9Z9_9BACT